ncbi:MAG: sulfotransferase [Cyanobacteria bacterium RI_101]|nr:sulfotransferase [Cyanobacteria bacterium RI_101]
MALGPDFIIIGGMKCATSTLHEQLALQPGFWMSEPKEPNFFSNDEIFAQGMDWYVSLFDGAEPGDLRGESSTHYSKLPTYPETVNRLLNAFPEVKLIYVLRHPIDRLVSQYVHEWSQLVIQNTEINAALETFPELIAYSRYAYQLAPYFERLPRERILPVFFERLLKYPQPELERVCAFLNYNGAPQWREELDAQNISSQRLRKSAWRDALVETPGLKQLRQALIPKSFRTWVRSLWTMKEKPRLSPASLAKLETIFDPDLAILGNWLGIELNCQNFKAQVTNQVLTWK